MNDIWPKVWRGSPSEPVFLEREVSGIVLAEASSLSGLEITSLLSRISFVGETLTC